MYQVRIQRSFCAAHALRLPDGTSEPMHGHNFHVDVRIASQSLDELETVVDFHWLEQAVDPILAPAQNADLNAIAPFAGPDGQLRINPSAERIAWWIGTEVAAVLPGHLTLHSVEVTEAPGCSAIYLP